MMLCAFTKGRAMASESAAKQSTMRAAPKSEGKTALDIFAARVEASGDRVALRHKHDGSWHTTSWNQWNQGAQKLAGGLIDLGVGVGDRVVILSDTRREWVVSDLGILMAGAIVVPIYPSSTPEQCEYIINDSGAKVVIAEDPHQLEKLLDAEVVSKLTGVEKVVLVSELARLERKDHKGRVEVTLSDVLGESGGDEPKHAYRDVEHIDIESWIISLADLQSAGAEWLGSNHERLEQIAGALDPAQPATFVYTSGTTGPPKGVVLTHSNIAFECNAVKDLLDLGADDEQLLFLPLAHSFARVLEWSAIAVGAVTAFAEGIGQLIQNMQEVKPTFMGAVPRVYEKAYVKIQSNFEAKRKKLIPGMLINWALRKGKQRSEIEQAGGRADSLGIGLADKLVFSKVRQTFGGRLRFFISGGAPLSREIAEFFHSAGILILEGYGLTETTAASHVNRPKSFKFGTVGQALPGVEVEIAEDGEILLRGGNILKEYYNKPDATAEAIDPDGWFHTGDVGVIDEAGRLKITDRKKDIIITAGGKNVAPQNIENAFKALCPVASQIMVYGDKRKYLSALITLSEEAIAPWARENSVSFSDYSDLTQKPEVRDLIQGYIDTLNADLAKYETIKKFAILDRDFDQATGELTPTMKVKRKFCSKKYEAILEGFYDDAASSL